MRADKTATILDSMGTGGLHLQTVKEQLARNWAEWKSQ